MNKQSPEYIRVREEIATKYCNNSSCEDGHDSCRWGTDPKYYCDRCKDFADSILEIKGIAIIADNQEVPKGLTARLNLPELDHYLYDETALSKSNFKKEA